MKYDAREETLSYYAEYCKMASLSITPEELLQQDMQKASTSGGVCIWTQNLVFLAWETDNKILWIEHAIGYLSDILPLASSYGPEWTVSYKHRDKIRAQNMHILLERL